MVELYIARRTGWGGSGITFYVGKRGWYWIAKWLPERDG